MPLHPAAQKLLDLLVETKYPEYSELTVAEVRALEAQLKRPPGPEARIRDLQMPGPGGPIALRAYYPPSAGPYPVLVYYHGGGFVLGGLESHDALCRQLCLDGDCAVVAVDYRLAPEAKFPAAINDAYTALCWVHENAEDLELDHNLLALGGDSAGGTLATVTTTLAKERRGPPIALQLLFYPVTDLRRLDTGSYLEFAQGHYLSRASMAWFRDSYLEDESQRDDPRASPMAATNLIGLPPSLIITAEYDVLRDEGEAYAEKLSALGNQVEHTRYDGMLHSFVSMYSYYDDGRRAIAQAGHALKKAFGRSD